MLGLLLRLCPVTVCLLSGCGAEDVGPDAGGPGSASPGRDQAGRRTATATEHSSGPSAGGGESSAAPDGGFVFQPITPAPPTGQDATGTDAAETAFPSFRNVGPQRGVVHVYDNGTTVRQLMTESTGGGAGWLDFDLDGRPDLFLPQAGRPDVGKASEREPDVLFRQRVDGSFREVAAVSGIACHEYGQGAAVGDYNNDGFPDLLITNVGANWLLTNNGDGTFTHEVRSVIAVPQLWSSSAAWGDVDHDGDVDLYVCNYAQYDPYNPIKCEDDAGQPTVCHPRNTPPEPDHFFLNNGDGTFTQAEQRLNLFGEGNRGLGVVIADLDRNGWQDIYVANDTTSNFVFLNDGQAKFQESALGFGGAVSAQGKSQASMGIAVGDYDRNGYLDLCLTHFSGESNTLYQNLGQGGLNDVSAITGLRSLTLSKLAFGAVMHDFDGNGSQEMIFANGHIDPLHPDGDGYEIAPQLVTWNGSRWMEWTPQTDGPFSGRAVGRGLALADFDGDGDTDVYLSNQNSPGQLLENTSDCGPVLRLRLIGTTAPRDGTGAVVTVQQDNEELPPVELINGYSFASAHENIVCITLPDDAPVTGTIRWTSGHSQSFTADSPRSVITLIEGR